MLVLGYLFLVLLPNPPGPIQTGINSFTYALSRLALDGWVFGRDVIFTYGPLGYLDSGAALAGTFPRSLVFRFAVHVALLVIALARLLRMESLGLRALFAVAVLCAYHPAFSPDYQLVFILLLLLSW